MPSTPNRSIQSCAYRIGLANTFFFVHDDGKLRTCDGTQNGYSNVSENIVQRFILVCQGWGVILAAETEIYPTMARPFAECTKSWDLIEDWVHVSTVKVTK